MTEHQIPKTMAEDEKNDREALATRMRHAIIRELIPDNDDRTEDAVQRPEAAHDSRCHLRLGRKPLPNGGPGRSMHASKLCFLVPLRKRRNINDGENHDQR
jgi:hypothetical protein